MFWLHEAMLHIQILKIMQKFFPFSPFVTNATYWTNFCPKIGCNFMVQTVRKQLSYCNTIL